MRAAAFDSVDNPSAIEIVDRPEPTPERGEAVVRVKAAALNHRDLWKVKDDRLEEDDLPFVPGADLAGTVVRTGQGVTHVSEGSRVVLCPISTCGTCRFCRDGPENMCERYSSYDGAFAEQARVKADRLVELPESVDFVTAAALPVSYMTAFRMFERGDVSAGDLVFVPGVTGGVGVAVVQLASYLGVETIGTSTSAEKLSRVEAEGLDHAIRTADAGEMRAAVGSLGDVDVTINHLAGPYTHVGTKVLGRDGVMVVCGRTAGRMSEFDAQDLYFGHKRILGSTLGTQPDLEKLVDLVENGQLDPLVDRTYPLAETARAFEEMDSRDVVGKLVVRPQER